MTFGTKWVWIRSFHGKAGIILSVGHHFRHLEGVGWGSIIYLAALTNIDPHL